jgi:hypothetical protein
MSRTLLSRKASGAPVRGKVPPVVNRVLKSPGEPLKAELRDFFGPRFGHDFSKVRVHADGEAGESARAVEAHAYAVGDHVAFAPDQFKPETRDGRRLLAHELAHTVQQSRAGGAGVPGEGLKVSSPGDPEELQADAAAADALQSEPGSVPMSGPGPVLPGSLNRQPATTPVVPPVSATPPTKGGYHTVAAGESLTAIAEKWYGDKALWTKIYDANKRLIGGKPNMIGVGMKLFVPPLDVEGKLGDEISKGMNISNDNKLIQYPNRPVGSQIHPDGYLDPTYWEAIPGGDWAFRVKAGQSASAAIDSLFAGETRLECQTMTQAVMARAAKETMGSEAFDRKFGSKGQRNQTLTVAADSAGYKASEVVKMLERPLVPNTAGLKKGDWVYFWNIREYHQKKPDGAWGGENAIYEGKEGGIDKFSGFGAGHLTVEQMNAELLKEYNSGLPAADQKTMAQWKAGMNERGGPPGLDMGSVKRLDPDKVEQKP